MSPLVRRWIAVVVVTSLAASLAGCGTLFYPERKGQLQGRIDPGVAIADGLGLLLFIVPGVIAYAVDFSNNTIYLPGTHEVSVDSMHYDGKLDERSLMAMIETRTGRRLDLHDSDVRIERPSTLQRALAVVAADAVTDADS